MRNTFDGMMCPESGCVINKRASRNRVSSALREAEATAGFWAGQRMWGWAEMTEAAWAGTPSQSWQVGALATGECLENNPHHSVTYSASESPFQPEMVVPWCLWWRLTESRVTRAHPQPPGRKPVGAEIQRGSRRLGNSADQYIWHEEAKKPAPEPAGQNINAHGLWTLPSGHRWEHRVLEPKEVRTQVLQSRHAAPKGHLLGVHGCKQ